MTFELFSSYLNRDTVTKFHVNERIRINLPTIYICTPEMYKNLQAYGNCDSPEPGYYNHVSCRNLKYECPDFCDNRMCENLDKTEKLAHGWCTPITSDVTCSKGYNIFFTVYWFIQ